MVNWVNAGRDVDLEALTTFHRLRDANRKFVDETRSMEKAAPDEAISRYRQALIKLEEYEGLTLERGLIAELCERSKYGEPKILDRLTLCLTSVGRQLEAKEAAERYFERFPDARASSIGERVIKRVNRVPCPTKQPG